VVHQNEREVVPRVDHQAREALFSYLASLPIVSLKATFGLPAITGQLYSVRILYQWMQKDLKRKKENMLRTKKNGFRQIISF